MADQTNGTGSAPDAREVLRQGAGTTPSGWDYVDGIMDAITPTAIVGVLSVVGFALLVHQGIIDASTTNALFTAAPAIVVGLMQFASYIRGIYTGRRPSTQV